MKWFGAAALAALLSGLLAGLAWAGDEASSVRGGRLYDHWSREAKLRPPGEPHPLLLTRNKGLSAADSWRCVSCHGWDYKGQAGFTGIRAAQGREPAAIVALLKDGNHAYGELLRERDLQDLANFVSQGQINMQAALLAGRRSPGIAAASSRIYSTVCANCHGSDGSQLREVFPLGDSARQRPLEVLHVLTNGHPGGDMPALSALGSGLAAELLGHLQTLPTLDLAASVAHGGRLYDDWQLEENARRQSLPHPSYPRGAFYANDAAWTWRCVACHGWDYQGRQGDFSKGRHLTGIKGIHAMAGAAPASIEAVLRNPSHRYDAVLKQRDLLDLANFVSSGQLDMDRHIDLSTRAAHGDARRGKAFFLTLCAGCHGQDGQSAGSPPLSRLMRANPWAALHSILNGHPDEKMPALRELDRQLLVDILAHGQTLPDTR